VSACVVCKANITGRQHALECDACGLWCHCYGCTFYIFTSLFVTWVYVFAFTNIVYA